MVTVANVYTLKASRNHLRGVVEAFVLDMAESD